MTTTIKPTVSRAKRMVMHSRKPISMLVEAQRTRVELLTQRIGHLMTQRVDEEEVLAELIELGRTTKTGVTP